MKIKLTNEIESVCGRFILPVNCELDVTDTDEQRGVYEASYNDGFFVIPFLCAEAIVEPLPVEQDYKGDSIQETLAAREANYGRFADQAELSQAFKNIARSAGKWEQLPADMKESIDMICHKMARVLNGKGAEYADNWHDIAGYATLVEDRLNEL